MMLSLRCQNIRLKPPRRPTETNAMEKRKCFRQLITISDAVLTVLKTLEGDPEGKIIVHCPSCHHGNFAEIKYRDGKLTYESMTSVPDLGRAVKFESVIIFSPINLVSKEVLDVQKEK